MILHKNQSGFTLIELLVVALIVGILGTLVAMTYSGVQSKDRNSRRQTDLNALKSQLETYYVQHSAYPTLADMNDQAWRKANFKDFPDDRIRDPSWGKNIKACSDGKDALLTASPASKCYSYQVRATDGNTCDNKKSPCAQYTLTAILEGGDRYVKSSLN